MGPETTPVGAGNHRGGGCLLGGVSAKSAVYVALIAAGVYVALRHYEQRGVPAAVVKR